MYGFSVWKCPGIYTGIFYLFCAHNYFPHRYYTLTLSPIRILHNMGKNTTEWLSHSTSTEEKVKVAWGSGHMSGQPIMHKPPT